MDDLKNFIDGFGDSDSYEDYYNELLLKAVQNEKEMRE